MQVQVHYALYDELDDAAALAALGPYLDTEEHARLNRMRRPEPWRHYLLAHALRRKVGGEISSLTHTAGAVAVAVAAEGKVGVDVEVLTRDIDPRDGFRRFFTDAEWTWIHQAETTARFLRLWTLKEAWSKAIGLGLGADFREAFGSGAKWGFEQWIIEGRYVLAAVASGSSPTEFRLIYNDLVEPARLPGNPAGAPPVSHSGGGTKK